MLAEEGQAVANRVENIFVVVVAPANIRIVPVRFTKHAREIFGSHFLGHVKCEEQLYHLFVFKNRHDEISEGLCETIRCFEHMLQQ